MVRITLGLMLIVVGFSIIATGIEAISLWFTVLGVVVAAAGGAILLGKR